MGKSFKQKLIETSATDLMNNYLVREFLHQENHIPRMFALLTNNKDRLFRKLGKHSGTFRSEYLHYIWIIEFEGHTFHLFTGNKGTSYELIRDGAGESFAYDEELGKLCVRFLRHVARMLRPYDKVAPLKKAI